ncbi:DUF927 domain-containing protein [Stenotrophomonas maltophilia]|uniref:DUF927 domain-containing protein n=1 Tax=Stenotrophomonas maltophilia TaxID=40324 RepID=UPI0013DAB493|nr:DUF927 domain-containing protein [Stenotrophomonas maltophilia]
MTSDNQAPLGDQNAPAEKERPWASVSEEMELLMAEGDPLDEGEVFYSGRQGQITRKGFWKLDREGVPYCVHPLPLWPIETIEVRRAEEVTTPGEPEPVDVYIRVRFARIHHGFGELKLPLGELNGLARRDHALTRAGWKSPSSRRAGAVEELLTDAMNDLSDQGKMPTRKGYYRTGWVEQDQHVRPGSEQYIGTSLGSTVTAGSRDVWAKAMTELMDDSGILSLCVAAALGSLFRGVVALPHDTSHILSLTGAPSRGKTTMLKVVSSLAGVPAKPGFVDGSSTARGLENRLAASNHGWMLLDEGDQLLMRDSDGGAITLMFITNGGGREKSSQSGQTVKGAGWTTTVIMSGNKSLLDLAASAKKGEALATRIFELDILDADLTTFSEISALPARLHALTENHGWAYPAAVDHISKHRGEWIQRFYENDQELRSNPRLRPIFNGDERLLAFFELALLGADLAEHAISKTASERCHDAVAIALARYEQEPEQGISQSLQRQHKLLLDLHEWLSFNAGRFVWKGYAWKEPMRLRSTSGEEYEPVTEGDRQIEQARYLSSSALGGGRGALGQVKQVRVMKDELDFEGELVLGAAALDELERVAKIDRAELTTAAKAFGLLQTNDQGRDGYKLSGALKAQLGGGSRGMKLLLRKPDLAEQVRLLAARPLTGAWKPAGWKDDSGMNDLWEPQDTAALEQVARENAEQDAAGYEPLHVPGFEDVDVDPRYSTENIEALFGGKP